MRPQFRLHTQVLQSGNQSPTPCRTKPLPSTAGDLPDKGRTRAQPMAVSAANQPVEAGDFRLVHPLAALVARPSRCGCKRVSAVSLLHSTKPSESGCGR